MDRDLGGREHQQQIQELIKENLAKWLRQLTCKLDVSPFLIRQADHEDLRFKSHILRIGQLFTDQIKAKGLRAKRTQKWCRQHMYLTRTKGFSPPNFPNLNPIDYFVRGEVEKVSNKDVQQSKVALELTIQDIMKKMSRPVVKRAYGRIKDWLERMQVALAAERGYIK